MKVLLFAKRVILFLVLNFVIFTSINLFLHIFNISPYLTSKGLNVEALLIFCLSWGMIGAFISLALSRMMAKWMMDIKIINPELTFGSEKALLETVYKLSRNAGLEVMPEVGIYTSHEINAFATGPSKDHALVAVSSSLLHEMNGDEIEGVLAHEVAHITNGDMVTMTLLQGVVNAFVMFLARVVAFIITRVGKRSDDSTSSDSFGMFRILTFLFEIVFMILGSVVIAGFSRFREYRADRGGAQLADREKMIAALRALQNVVDVHDDQKEESTLQVMKISNAQGLLRLFSTHPPLEERIRKLQGTASEEY